MISYKMRMDLHKLGWSKDEIKKNLTLKKFWELLQREEP